MKQNIKQYLEKQVLVAVEKLGFNVENVAVQNS